MAKSFFKTMNVRIVVTNGQTKLKHIFSFVQDFRVYEPIKCEKCGNTIAKPMELIRM